MERIDLAALSALSDRLNQLTLGELPQPYPELLYAGETEVLRDIFACVNKLSSDMVELNNFSFQLSAGHLDCPPPSRRNYMSAHLKSLHAHLLHLTFQTQCIQAGDYSQSVDFMGDFSAAFNSMVRALDERTLRMEFEIEASRAAREALARSQKSLEVVLEGLNDIIAVTADGAMLFTNAAAKREFARFEGLEAFLLDVCANGLDDAEYYDKLAEQWFFVKSIPVEWPDSSTARLLSATDVTQQKRDRNKLLALANVDELTGVETRRSGLRSLNKVLREEENYPICLCYLDLDRLKHVNDHFGHAAGDTYIKALSQSIVQSVRQDDIVFRIGGDEFVVVLLNQNKTSAGHVLARVQAKLCAMRGIVDESFPLSFSHGIEEIPQYDGLSAEVYIAAADQKMYLQKRAGGDPTAP